MSKIPILALPSLAVILVVVFLVVLDPQTEPTLYETVTATTQVTSTPFTRVCEFTETEELYLIKC